MKQKIAMNVGKLALLGGALGMAVQTFAFNASTTDTLFQSFGSDVGDTLTNNLPLILAILAGLIGLGMLIRYFKRHIGKK